jgi:hypothetical protein
MTEQLVYLINLNPILTYEIKNCIGCERSGYILMNVNMMIYNGNSYGLQEEFTIY